jgi:thioesterase domain-containing protein
LPIARKIAAELKRKAGNVLKAGSNILQPLHKTRKLDGDNADGGLLPLALSVSDTLHRARAKYKPRAYPGRIVLFRAIAPDPRHELADDLGWTAVAEGGLEIHYIPGNHTTMFERPHVQAGAEKLAACIQAVLPVSAL